MTGATFLGYTASVGVTASHIYEADNAFMSIYDPSEDSHRSTSSTRAYDAMSYVSSDNTDKMRRPTI